MDPDARQELDNDFTVPFLNRLNLRRRRHANPRAAERFPVWVPTPPDGSQPTAWYQTTRTRRVQAGIGAVAIVAVFWLVTDAGAFASSWEPYAWMLGAGALLYFLVGGTVLVANPGWIYYKHGLTRTWVDLDQLTTVGLVGGPTGFHELAVSDSSGKKLAVSLDDLRQEPGLYDTAIAGIKEARNRGGVEVDEKARNWLDGTEHYH
jgi:hypothetical protein